MEPINPDIEIRVPNTIVPLSLEFSNVGYTIDTSNTKHRLVSTVFSKTNPKKTIITGISGSVEPGEVLVILGSSGCGKTTLLNILSGRITENVTGNIKVNGEDITKNKHRIAYVTQTDNLIPNITVKQNLTFTSKLKQPDSEQYRIQEVIDMLNINGCSNQLVGGGQVTLLGRHVGGISGGEKKRVAIGNEILTGPSMIFLDEPTSGLDSAASLSLFKNIKDLAAAGRTVVVVLHQPSSEMFSMFDKLMIMADGKLVYYGNAGDAIEYFASKNCICPPYYNPADYFLKITSNEEQKTDLINRYSKNIDEYINLIYPILGDNQKVNNPKVDKHKFNRSWFEQIFILFQRHWLLAIGNIHIFPYLQLILVALAVGLIWWQLDFTDENIPIKNSVLFLGMVFGVGYAPLFQSMTQFFSERSTIVKERASGTYYVSAYFIAKRMAEMPIEIVSPILYTMIVYWMVGFRRDAYFLLHLLIMIITSYTSSAFGICIGAGFSNFNVALTFCTAGVLTLIMVSGFYIPVNSLPVWMRWLSWISYFRYAFEAAIFTEYTNRWVAHVPNSTFFSNNLLNYVNMVENTTDIISSKFVFQQLALKTSLWISITSLFGYMVLFHVIAYILILVLAI